MKIGIDLKGINFEVKGSTIIVDTEKSLLENPNFTESQIFNIITVEETANDFDDCKVLDIGKISILKNGEVTLNN